MKLELKNKAINLRRQGLSYSEILKQVPVSKSTLSLWLRSVGLSKRQKQRLTKKKLEAMRRGSARKREIRIELIDTINKETKKDVYGLTNRDLWLTGIMLYWAKGSKEKEHNIAQATQFGNSDPKMIKVFMKWLKEIIKVPENELDFEIYIHKTGDPEKALNYWSKVVSCNKSKFKVYFKRHRLGTTNRKNVKENYYGLMRIRVKKSSTLNRKISAWIKHICDYWGVD